MSLQTHELFEKSTIFSHTTVNHTLDFWWELATDWSHLDRKWMSLKYTRRLRAGCDVPLTGGYKIQGTTDGK